MSRTLQQVEIEGQAIWVEVTDINLANPRTADLWAGKFSNTATRGAAEQVAETIIKVDLSATLAAVIGPVKTALEKFRPDEVNVELTLGFKGEVGVFIASGEANAQVKVSAKWKPEPAKDPTVGAQ